MSQRFVSPPPSSPSVMLPYRELGLWWFGAFGFIVVGIMFSWYSLYSLLWLQPQQKEITTSWARVPACVESGYVLHTKARQRRASVHHTVKVHYSYTYCGVRYESDNVGKYNREDMEMLDSITTDAKRCGSKPDDYLAEKLLCYVNPASPAESQLFCRPASVSIGWTVIGIAVALLTVPLGVVLLCRYTWLIVCKTALSLLSLVKRG